jgi:hypothetical protein
MIYFESMNQTDASVESSKLNLLLFEKHENGIQLEDYRNEKLKTLYEQKSKNGGNSISSGNSGESSATGSYDEIYTSDPSTFVGAIGITTSDEDFREQLLANINDSEQDDFDIIKKSGGSFIPLVDPNDDYYFMAMKESKLLPSKNNNEINPQEPTPKLGGISPLLESRLSVTLPGIGGVEPLQFFRTDGLPDVYDKRGDFCILSVSHTITPNDWSTSIGAAFRIKGDNE